MIFFFSEHRTKSTIGVTARAIPAPISTLTCDHFLARIFASEKRSSLFFFGSSAHGMYANNFSGVKCFKRQTNEVRNKQSRHKGYFADEDEDHSHELRLFVADCALSASKEDEDNIWYVDSGASSHMTGKKEWFEFLEETSCGSKIYL